MPRSKSFANRFQDRDDQCNRGATGRMVLQQVIDHMPSGRASRHRGFVTLPPGVCWRSPDCRETQAGQECPADIRFSGRADTPVRPSSMMAHEWLFQHAPEVRAARRRRYILYKNSIVCCSREGGSEIRPCKSAVSQPRRLDPAGAHSYAAGHRIRRSSRECVIALCVGRTRTE